MSKRLWLPALLLSLALASGPVTAAEPPITQAQAAAVKIGDPVSEAQFAWLLFVQAMQPASGMLMFETWTEQCQLNPSMVGCPSPSAIAAAASAGGRRILHGSPLLQANRRKTGEVASPASPAITQGGAECNSMQKTALNGYPPPSNLSANPTFCEQVFVNPPEQNFLAQNGLITLSGQQAYGARNGNAITFPWDAIEVKADWVPTTSYTGPSFSCPDPNLYTQVLNGVCYALVGLHISSKALPDWLWATFEPASAITNPNRCDPALYNACFDPWGTTSSVSYGKGQTVPQSPQLQQLMASAGLNPVLKNYYLTGVQTQFVNSSGKPVPLGSSFVEFNAGVNPGQASCITCHKYAYFDGKNPGKGVPQDNFGGAPAGWSSVGYACTSNPSGGNCTPVAPNSTSQDFSWVLGLMPF
ncbi:MAG: hypothetical protein QOD89_21 [Bradyrhizobium sp.]|nr:hypothetical protein [Bradyrhizobium sp.]